MSLLTNRMLAKISSAAQIAFWQNVYEAAFQFLTTKISLDVFQFKHFQLAQNKESSKTPKRLRLIRSIQTTFSDQKIWGLLTDVFNFNCYFEAKLFCHFHSKLSWVSQFMQNFCIPIHKYLDLIVLLLLNWKTLFWTTCASQLPS